MGSLHETVEQMQAEVEELRTQLRLLQTDRALTDVPDPPDATVAAPAVPPQDTSSRRTLFKVGAAAAAAAVVAPGFAKPALADDGGNLIIGGNNTSGGGHTRLNSTGTGLLSNQNVFTVTDGLTSSSFASAIGAYAQGDRVYNGLYAYADDRDNANSNTGHPIVARRGSFGRSNMYLPASGGDPRSDGYVHSRGELRSSGGDLWWCAGSGTPGTWRKITGPAASGSVHALTPARVYDSRLGGGPLVGGSSRVVSVANGIDRTGAVNIPNLVPPGATAVFFNLAIVNTVAAGFLAATPGDAAAFSAASINWSAGGQIVNNGTVSKLDSNRQLKLFAGGTTDFIVDITAYTV